MVTAAGRKCRVFYAVYGHAERLPASTPANQALRLHRSRLIRHLTDLPVKIGSDVLVVRVVGEWITTLQLACGILPPGESILEQCYGQR